MVTCQSLGQTLRNSHTPAYEPTLFEVEVTNIDSNPSEPRTVGWYVCIGEKVTNVCISQSIDDGDIEIPVIEWWRNK